MERAQRDTLGWRIWVWIVGVGASSLLRLLGRSWRIRELGDLPGPDQPFVGATWHRGVLAAAAYYRDRGAVVPVSHSRDGDLIDAVLGRLGYQPSPRGSSSRGGAAVLRQLIRAGRQGRVMAILVDGPRGPAGEVKPGVLALGQATGLLIHPVGVAARPCLRFGSWDRTLLPLPFAEVVFTYGKPLCVPKHTDNAGREKLRLELAEQLHQLDTASASGF